MKFIYGSTTITPSIIEALDWLQANATSDYTISNVILVVRHWSHPGSISDARANIITEYMKAQLMAKGLTIKEVVVERAPVFLYTKVRVGIRTNGTLKP